MNIPKKYFIHFIGITAFLVIPVLFAPKPPEAKFVLLERPTVRDILACAIMLGMFYLNYYLLIPRLYFRKKYFVYGMLVVAGFICVGFLPSLLTGHDLLTGKSISGGFSVVPVMPNNHRLGPRPDEFSPLQEIRHHIFLYIAVIMFSVLLRVQNRLMQSETHRLKAELSQLKAQIHPHFLFNTLNSIYSLVIRKDDNASETIVKLSDFMRYLLQDSNREKVALQNELYYIENYIALQKARLRKAVQVNYQFDGIIGEEQIAPLILFTYIDNAFKHGVNPEDESVIDVRLLLQKNMLTMKVVNNIVTTVSAKHIQSLNIGLNNTQNRLAMLYPDKHILHVHKTDKNFEVNLTLQLD